MALGHDTCLTLFWHPHLRVFKDSPDAGPHCQCSWCVQAILNEGDCVRLFVERTEVRLHRLCWAYLEAEETLLFEDLWAYWAYVLWLRR